MKTVLYILGGIYVAGVLWSLSFGLGVQAALLWPVRRLQTTGITGGTSSGVQGGGLVASEAGTPSDLSKLLGATNIVLPGGLP